MNKYDLFASAGAVCARGLICYLYKVPADKGTIFNGVDILATVTTYFVLDRLLHHYYVQAVPQNLRKGRDINATLISVIAAPLAGLVAGVFTACQIQVNFRVASISSCASFVGICAVILMKESHII